MYLGIDSVKISRIEDLIKNRSEEELLDFFSKTELIDSFKGKNKTEKLAGRFAAKEACCKLFPKEIALGKIEPTDFFVTSTPYGNPIIDYTNKVHKLIYLYNIKSINISITHTNEVATAIATCVTNKINCPWYGKLAYYLIPLKRNIILDNLNKVFSNDLSQSRIKNLAQLFYAHIIKSILELICYNFFKKEYKIKIIGHENIKKALDNNKGALLLTGHFGNWELSTVLGISKYKDKENLFYFIRKPIKPKWLNNLIKKRFSKVGLGVIEKSNSLDQILDLISDNKIIILILDQFAIKEHSIDSMFFNLPAKTFKSLSVLAQFTDAPVLPSSSWREEDGTHILKFDKPLDLITEGKTSDIIKQNTLLFNQKLEEIILKHPEQWIWMHRRWKTS